MCIRDRREHDDFLESAGVEGGIGFEQADQNGAEGGDRVGGEAADDGADEAFEADQEAGVVVNGGDRRNQDAGEGTDGSGQREAEFAGEGRRNAHQAGAGTVPVSYTHLDVYKRQASCLGEPAFRLRPQGGAGGPCRKFRRWLVAGPSGQ